MKKIMYKKFLKEWYTLNKSQRNGTLILISILTLIVFVKIFYKPSIHPNTLYYATIEVENDSNPNHTNPQLHLFFFDPNTASESELNTLGLSNKIVQNIIRYRQKGGKFYTKEDIKKIYGINDSIYQSIEPYLLIALHSNAPPSNAQNKKILFTKHENKPDTKATELNNADSIALVKLKGIGPVLSSRIIKYRNRLGGFYCIEQLKEVYGIKDSIYKFIIEKNHLFIDTNNIKKINVYLADFKTMIRHPYFNKDMVVKILQLQKKQEKISEEKLKTFIPESDWKKLHYYISY